MAATSLMTEVQLELEAVTAPPRESISPKPENLDEEMPRKSAAELEAECFGFGDGSAHGALSGVEIIACT